MDKLAEGIKVKVSPSVIRRVEDETCGSVAVCVPPITTTPELDTMVLPSGAVQVVAWPTGVPAGAEQGGDMQGLLHVCRKVEVV